MQNNIIADQEEQGFPEELHEDGRVGVLPARTWRVHAEGLVPSERLKIEEADGGSSRQKEYDSAVSAHGSI